jgi:hypothetical protein
VLSHVKRADTSWHKHGERTQTDSGAVGSRALNIRLAATQSNQQPKQATPSERVSPTGMALRAVRTDSGRRTCEILRRGENEEKWDRALMSTEQVDDGQVRADTRME